MKPGDIIPAENHYLTSNHPGTGVWRHARTALTPEYPRWMGEGTPCRQNGCEGSLQTYKLCPTDTGVDAPDEWRLTGSIPHSSSHAGDWICDACYTVGPIMLREVIASPGETIDDMTLDNVINLVDFIGDSRG